MGRQAMAHLVAIVRGAHDAIVSKTLDGTITSWNPGAEQMFGYSEQEALGQPIALIVPPDRIAEEDDILARLKAGDRVDHLETERVRKDGGHIPVSLTVSPVMDAAGRVVGASKIVRDISGRKELEQARKQVEEARREADHRKDDFLAMLGHELRNPLAAIAAAAAVLSTAAHTPDPSGRPLEIIRRQTELLNRLVGDLVDVTRITAGKFAMDVAPLDLSDATEACVTTLRAAGRLEKHRLDLHADHIWIYGDRARVEQIITNLLTNAIKYTPDGGVITLRVERADDQAVLRVKDNGMGIPSDLLPRVFDLFSQGAPPAGRRPEGLGVGLTLVHQLVELHGGRIDAHSDGPDRGSEFVVRFPNVRPSTPPVPQPDSLR
jgi:PAS domain S-box-containing protein